MPARSSEALQDNAAGVKSASSIDISATDATLSRITRALYVAVSGDVVVQFVGDNASVTLTGLAGGCWHAMQIQKVIKTGTTATGLVAGY